MNTLLLEELLSQEEGIDLEFKEVLDLESKAGKAKFLKGILALANSAIDHSNMILGVENKTKRLVGIQGVSEEQLQQIVADECKPPISFSFATVQYGNVAIGIIQIPRSYRKPHTIKKIFSYPDSGNGKQQEIRENQVFVRRGSTTREATTDEIIEMAQDRRNDSEFGADVEYRLERIDSSLQEIVSSLDYRNDRHKFPNRWLEGTFVGTILGLLTGWLTAIGWTNASLGATIIGPIVAMVLSVLRLVQYGILRTVFTGVFIGITFTVIFRLITEWAIGSPFFAGPEFVMWLVYGVIAGTTSGAIGTAWLGYAEKTFIRR